MCERGLFCIKNMALSARLGLLVKVDTVRVVHVDVCMGHACRCMGHTYSVYASVQCKEAHVCSFSSACR